MLNATWIRTNPLYLGVSEGYLGYIDLLMNNEKEARRRLKQGLETSVEYLNQTPNLIASWMLIEGQARLDVIDGHMQRAALLFGASWTQRDIDNWPLTGFERPDYEASVSIVRAALGEETFNQLFDKGKAMSLKDAVALALEDSAS